MIETFSTRRTVYAAALLLAIVTIVAATSQQPSRTIRTVSLSDLKVEITTDKTTYRIGETITGTIWLVNDSTEPVRLAPVFTAYLTAGYEPDLYSVVVNIDYASSDSDTVIPAGGRIGFIPLSYKAGKPGTFQIDAYGSTAKTEVTAPQYEALTPEPQIPSGYSTDGGYRIEGVNLTQVTQLARDMGFKVMSQDYIHEWTPGNGTIHVSAIIQLPENSERAIELNYDKYADVTHVHLSIPANPGETFDPLLDRLSRYMHRSEAQLNATAWDVDRGTLWVSFTASGQPDWDEVRADAGHLVERHTRLVGNVFELYDSESFVNTMTSYTIIEEEKTVEVGSVDLRVVLRLSIDDEGDFRLDVYESAPVRFDDPGVLFATMFDSIGLSRASLGGVGFVPSWWLDTYGYYP